MEAIIEKYRRKSEQELRYGDEKCYYFETVADDIETNFIIYLDDSFETEEDILEVTELWHYTLACDIYFAVH